MFNAIVSLALLIVTWAVLLTWARPVARFWALCIGTPWQPRSAISWAQLFAIGVASVAFDRLLFS